MRFTTISIFSVAGRLVALATAKPLPNWSANGIAIPLSRHPSDFLNFNKSIDLDAITSHGISVREKITSGLDNYEINTGTMHPFAVKRSELGLRKRGANLALTNYQTSGWMGEISIGTPPQTLKVQIDTAAADMWVLQTGCSGISGDRNLWNPDSSESAKKEDQSFSLLYADDNIVEGDLYTDNVTIAGFTADPQTFGSATESYTSPVSRNEHADGLFGLAFPSLSDFQAYPLFLSLVRQNRLLDPVFSLKLSASGAEMYVGGANSMLYNGAITYTPVTHPALWQVSMDDVRVNGNKILENVPAILDAGSNFIYGDREGVSRLYRPLGGAIMEHEDFDFYYLPCDSFPTVSFTFAGKTFAIPPGALRLDPVERGSSYCFSAIVADHSPSALWTIGIPFLQGVYSVFDYGEQVGFAELV